tara:strand:- start:27273 stop:27689 length:417 start_codon:yes stop_codon:yes gene_type:complete
MKDIPLDEGKNSALVLIDTMNTLLHWQSKIEVAMAHVNNMFSFNDVVAMVCRGELDLLTFPDSCVLMQREQYPAWATYHCFLACGNMQEIKNAEAEINIRAKKLGCKYMSISGRTGWSRALKNDGWDHLISVLYKETY